MTPITLYPLPSLGSRVRRHSSCTGVYIRNLAGSAPGCVQSTPTEAAPGRDRQRPQPITCAPSSVSRRLVRHGGGLLGGLERRLVCKLLPRVESEYGVGLQRPLSGGLCVRLDSGGSPAHARRSLAVASVAASALWPQRAAWRSCSPPPGFPCSAGPPRA